MTEAVPAIEIVLHGRAASTQQNSVQHEEDEYQLADPKGAHDFLHFSIGSISASQWLNISQSDPTFESERKGGVLVWVIGMRLGLCCAFANEPIRFRTATAKSLLKLGEKRRVEKLKSIVTSNVEALSAAIEYCARPAHGAFRINSQILPLKTHPELGYEAALIGEELIESFHRCGNLARTLGVRLSFHPDQFVVLSSPNPAVVESSIAEIEYQAEVAEWLGADVINIHGGGGYGNKSAALERLIEVVERLSPRARKRLALENDDRVYTPSDLLPVCRKLRIPLVYDVHHHRCNSDQLILREAMDGALDTWEREPLFHVSSPRDGWRGGNPRRHADTIDLRDFPGEWEDLDVTVDVEAKAKEVALTKLAVSLARRRRRGMNRRES